MVGAARRGTKHGIVGGRLIVALVGVAVVVLTVAAGVLGARSEAWRNGLGTAAAVLAVLLALAIPVAGRLLRRRCR